MGALAALLAAWFDARFGVRACSPWDLGLGIGLTIAWVLGRNRRISLLALARVIFAGLVFYFLGVIRHEAVQMPEFLLWVPIVPLAACFFFGPREGAAWSALQGLTAFPTALWYAPAQDADTRGMIVLGAVAYLCFTLMSVKQR